MKSSSIFKSSKLLFLLIFSLSILIGEKVYGQKTLVKKTFIKNDNNLKSKTNKDQLQKNIVAIGIVGDTHGKKKIVPTLEQKQKVSKPVYTSQSKDSNTNNKINANKSGSKATNGQNQKVVPLQSEPRFAIKKKKKKDIVLKKR